ncbi:electron transfer flavoprotein subunit beta/FixA family protein [Arthrobacter sp. MYb213]|uniref:electron transfer flavoprotein subunit beta/FixA family protein n=1 Tax=Arthrobacter sp. MYb213 TaxID=1848595 RepID=UPI000CFB5EAB|nr:electron transfer flavoprotein subunit beta/FixA family protein [Arthrobacter sp. MYb213]PRB67521.1 electron transfer flavoprotein subunit beta [Arthrobacter sp. MYb213]
MKIAVLTKQVPDTWSSRRLDLQTGMLDRAAADLVADEICERACEVALQAEKSLGEVEVIAVAMGGDKAALALRRLLSMGAHSAVHISDPALAGSDMISTARVLAAALEKLDVDLVLAGNESTDGKGGMVPAMIAELMDRPFLPYADELEISATEATGSSQLSEATMKLSVAYPAVVSVTEKSAEPRFPNFKGIRAAKTKPLETWTLADLSIEAGPESAYYRSVMVSAEDRPERVAGPKITDDGTAAKQLADFLAEKHFI